MGFEDPETDRLIEAGTVAVDLNERRAINNELQRRLQELQPIASLFHTPIWVLYDDRLRGLAPSDSDYVQFTREIKAWSWSPERP